MTEKSIHGLWSGRLAFILAATGSAVGLGNIWKFPYITGENGGGAFVLFYLLCIAIIGIPIMMAEVMLGRRGRQNPIGTMKTLALEENASSKWKWLGGLGVVTGIMILSYYSVIAGWALSYFFEAVAGTFKGISASASAEHFGSLVGSWDTLLGWHTMFMGLTLYVVSKGVRGGLEKAVTLLMPALFILLLIMVGYAMQTGSFQKGLDFLFSADFSKLNKESALIAMGHAFFTLSLGMGAIMAYGSYLPKDVSIAKAGIAIALADTAVALLAGMAIFPIVFANGLEPSSGPGLIFTTLPIAFGQMPFGNIFASIFFLLLIFAAWTSAISLIEPAVAWLVEKAAITRLRATVLMGGVTWLVGIGSILSFNVWSDAKFLDKTFFDWMDYLTSNIMLPFGGLLIALFAGWVMRRNSSQEELGLSSGMHGLWSFLVKYVAIIAVSIVMLKVSGLMDWAINLF
ncbi:MAG: sodium-dependent transporter [Thiotrichaceae bacterium]